MSWRVRLLEKRTRDWSGDVRMLQLFRDNDTKTYRVFTSEGVTDCPNGGYTLDRCSCVDLTHEELAALAQQLTTIAATHTPWPDEDDDDE